MIIYHIKKPGEKSFIKPDAFIPFSYKVILLKESKLNKKDVNYSYMKKCYGIHLSNLEVAIYKAHIKAWNHFLSTEEKNCLIIENTKSLLGDFSKKSLDILKRIPKDWHLFYPFNGLNNNTEANKGYYILGHFWGPNTYFLNKKGAVLLLKRKKIRQPLSEEILQMSLKEKMNIYYENMRFFSFFNNDFYLKDRNETIKRLIYNINVWKKGEKEQIKNILKSLSSISRSINIHLVLEGGSMLGYARHNGKIIPWDADADLGVERSSIHKLIDSINQDGNLITKKYIINNIFYYKVWSKNGKPVKGLSHLFPFVDIWPYQIIDDEVIYDHKCSTFPISYFYPLKSCIFEDCLYYVPNKIKECLNLKYKDWDKYVQLFPLDHKKGKYVNFPLRAKI